MKKDSGRNYFLPVQIAKEKKSEDNWILFCTTTAGMLNVLTGNIKGLVFTYSNITYFLTA